MCDFNLSRVMEQTGAAVLSSMAASNPRWLAPEILGGRGYTFSSDVYSFGIVMWELMTWRLPWHDCGPWQVGPLVYGFLTHRFLPQTAGAASGQMSSSYMGLCC